MKDSILIKSNNLDDIDSRSHVALGISYREAALISKAYYHYHQALQLEPDMPEANYQLALLMHEQGEWDLAAAHYRAVIEAEPNCSAKVYYNWGLLSHQCGQYGLAAACYGQAIAIQPKYIRPYLKLAAVMQRQEASSQEAVVEHNGKNISEFYEDLLTRFPHIAVVHNHVGEFFQQKKQFANALYHYERALRLNPHLAKVHHNLAILWSEQKQALLAVRHYSEAAKHQATPTTLGNWAKFHLQQGDFAKFLRVLQQAISLSPTYINAYCDQFSPPSASDHLAKVRHSCANLLKTLQISAADYNPDKALHYLADTYIQSAAIAYEARNFHRAEQRYHLAVALKPRSKELRAQLADCLRHQARMAAATSIDGIHDFDSANDTEHSPSKPSISQTSLEVSQLGQSNSANQSCSVTCPSCMGELIQAFRPEALAKGLYRVRFDNPPCFPFDPDHIEFLRQGQAWVSPRESDWAACHEVIVSDSKDKAIDSICRQYPWRLPNCPKPPFQASFQSSRYPKIHRLKGQAALLSSLSGHVYYHWMIDLLPRIGILESQGIDLSSIDWFIVNSIQSSFQRETLMQLGIPMEKVIESDRHPHIQANQLIVPSFPGHLDWVPQRTIDFLRAHFLKADPSSLAQPQGASVAEHTRKLKRIYISRKHAQYRHVLNEAEIEAILAPLGFETVHLEKMTVREQAQLFAQAEIIISPHGSGLTNLVFCQPDTTIIELFAPRYLRTDYWMVSQLLNLNHYYVVGYSNTCEPLRDLMFQSALTEDIYVEPASIRSAIRINQIR